MGEGSVVRVLGALLVALLAVAGLTLWAISSLPSDNVVEYSDWIYLDGVRYDPCSQRKDLHISNVLIAKTKSGGKIYAIDEYPDHEYIALYYGWDGEIYQRTNQRLEDDGT